MKGLALGALLCAISASAASSPGGAAFEVRSPEQPLKLELASPRLPAWGRTPELRLIYYTTDGVTPNDVDRATILRELQLIKDFYAHYGLIVRHEPRVYEVRAVVPKDLPAEQRDYYFILKELKKRDLLLTRRTIVFTTFDVGLGAEMALTGLNDATVRKLECPRPEKGPAWWCGRPEAAHWGGSVHEVGHMFGLSHPDEFTAKNPYIFADGKTEYVYCESDAKKSVMKRHDQFFRHPDNGLLAHEVDALYRKFHDPGAESPRP